MAAYYNENDPSAAAWLRELVKAGHIADGQVDERSILDVTPADLAGFTQCHFFAGIGVWSAALRRARWPDHRRVWTGSCPCQPFSAAGKGAGFADERHLWPAFFWLIAQCRPDVVFGEQVAGKAGLAWLDLVSTDLEGEGYACGAAVTAACGFGAPHLRSRLYWVADAAGAGLERGEPRGEPAHAQQQASERDGAPRRLADAELLRRDAREPGDARGEEGAGSEPGPLDDRRGASGRPGPTNGFWRDAHWLGCRDDRFRPVEPGTFPLADGAPARVGRLRGYGNALVLPQAQAFIEAYQETVA